MAKELKLINYEKWTDSDGVSVWIDDGENYVDLEITPEGSEQKRSLPKKDYKDPEGVWSDYEWFAAIMGKFNPYTFFFEEPIPISDISYETIMEAIKRREKRYPISSKGS